MYTVLACILFYLLGFWTFYWLLGKAGFLGRLVQGSVKKRLKGYVEEIVEVENDDPNLPGRKSRLKYGKYKQED